MSATALSRRRLVARPERHAPHRIADAVAGRGNLGGKGIVVGVERRQLRAQRHAGGARQRGEADDRVGLLLVGERQRIGQHQPALGVGVADLDRLAGAARSARRRGGRRCRPCCCPPPGSARAAARRASLAMIMCASASAAAAPPMSFFMISMALAGLMSRPPVSKQMPLPTSVTRGAVASAPGEVDQPRRAVAGPADGVDHRKVLGQQVVADDARHLAPCRLASRRAASSSCCGPRSLAGVLMRSRPSHTPSTVASARS